MANRQFWPRLPREIFSRSSEEFIRLRVQSFELAQQYIVDGIAFSTNWVETGISTTSPNDRRFVAFDVPAGYYLALDYRLLNTSSNEMWYFVYPEGTYTLGAASGNSGSSFVKTRNLRQDAPLAAPTVARYAVSSLPIQYTDSIIDQPIWGSSGDEGEVVVGALSQDNNFLLLEPDQQFLLEVFNDGTGNANIQVELVYALVPADRVAEVAS